jgi:hypothetical protein
VFVSDYLGVNSQQLIQAITANETTDGGWMATVSQDLMNALNLQVAYVGILKTEESQEPDKNWLVLVPEQRVCHWIPSSTFAIQHKIGIQNPLDIVTSSKHKRTCNSSSCY